MPPKRIHPLKVFRIAHQLSQRQAAKRFRVSQSAWSRWERGVDRPNKTIAKKLIQQHAASADVLLGIAS